MKSWTIILLLILGSCTLSADQESSLNAAMVSYINSRNNGVVMSYVACTHPNVVSYYKNQGDSLFKKQFDLSNENERPFFQDGIIKKVKSEASQIHVKYNFKKITFENFSQSFQNCIILAISEDKGQTWFFVESKDYFNNDIFTKENRLIEKE